MAGLPRVLAPLLAAVVLLAARLPADELAHPLDRPARRSAGGAPAAP
ncbi:hypothetical protein [Geodermatophilus sp. SYSU D00079]